MPTIDVQVHAYERNHAARPWVGHLAGPTSVTGAEMVAAMDTVGVDGAILVSPFALYRYAQPRLRLFGDYGFISGGGRVDESVLSVARCPG